jgi:hypothetical protein
VKRRSKASIGPAKARRRKAQKPKDGNTPTVRRRGSAGAGRQTEVAQLRRELHDAHRRHSENHQPLDLRSAAQSRNLSIGGIISQAIAGGAGGAILTAIIGAIKNRAAAGTGRPEGPGLAV